jgi:hypothetical protein
MAATVQIAQCTGAGPTYTDDIAAFRLRATQDVDDDTTNAILIPEAGSTAYSYEVKLRLKATVTPVTAIANIKFYSDGGNGLGTGVTVAAGTQAAASYSQPVVTDSAVATTNLFSYTAAAPLSVTGSLSNPDTGYFSDYVVLQMDVASTVTTTSNGNSETVTFKWDET